VPVGGVSRPPDALPDVLCLSHLRWDFVFQRPQHLMTRCARERRVFFFEEPVFDTAARLDRVDVRAITPSLHVLTPRLAGDSRGPDEQSARLRRLLDAQRATFGIRRCVLWYWTPMALPFTCHVDPELIVFDCMDDLSGFAGASAALPVLERELLTRADVVFTGGQSLYEARSASHPNIHPFPSSVDVAHFRRARTAGRDPEDQASLPHPRLGYFGVIDERMDLALIAGLAEHRPDWQIVLLGPTAKIDPAALPRARNIHYLGMKSYDELPDYLAGWDVALLPFALNDATRFISPTKTPEYLAAGCPVVSTPIRDVVRPYGERGLVRIADSVAGFADAAAAAMAEARGARLARVDGFLDGVSWETTWTRMAALMGEAQARRTRGRPQPPAVLNGGGPAATPYAIGPAGARHDL
jgi:UDP-galactopyranose mutase